MASFQIRVGDALTTLRRMRANSVDCCVTSPPYFGLRDYGVNGQIGLERTPDAFVSALADVFDEVYRVLKPKATLWLNLGDSYAAGKAGRTDYGTGDPTSTLGPQRNGLPNNTRPGPVVQRRPPAGLKPKDLIGIPWRVAFELQKRGWYLRSDIIWHKPNPMPESVRDRPTKAHEYIFLLTKSEKYYYDAAAVAEPAIDPEYRTRGKVRPSADGGRSTRNRRTVWSITTRPYKGAHFATFPPKLIEPCILAGSPEGGLVLDPFNGAGTTGLVATQHGRRYIGIELHPKYARMAEDRIRSAMQRQRKAA